MTRFVILLSLLALLGASHGCEKATATSEVYSSRQSGVLSSIPFIAKLSVTCGDGSKPGPLYARVGDRTLPALKVPGNKYQVSWTEETSEASGGDREIHIYTEAGYTALRKAMRSDQDVSSVPTLTTVTLSHSTGYTGPMINSEVTAAILAALIAYVALTNKSRLLS